MKKYICLFIIILNFSPLFSQKRSDVLIVPTNVDFFGACINTQFEVYARQGKSITKKEIKAKLIKSYEVINDSTFLPITKELDIEETGNNSFCLSSVDTLGTIEFEIKLESGIEIVRHKVKVIPIRLEIGHRDLSHDSFPIIRLKNSKGLVATVDYRGLDAYAKIVNFTIIGVADGKIKGAILNKGGYFNEKVSDMISELKPNDMIIITDLTYQICSIQEKYKQNIVLNLK